MTHQSLRTLAVFCLPFLFIACQPDIPEDTIWRGSASIADGRSIPFVLETHLSADPPTATFIVGDDRTPVPEVIVDGRSLHLIAAEYNAAFRLQWDGQTLSGPYERYRTDTTGFEVSAVPHVPADKEPGPAPAVPLTGSYRSFRTTGSGLDSSRTAVFWTRGDSVFGTLIAPSGDDGLFAGTQQGDTATLARFTAWQSIYLELVRRGTEWHGSRYMRDLPPSTFVLRARSDDIHEEPSGPKTRLRPGLAGFSFRGITPEGDTLDHMSDRFVGKPLIIDIMGTWCHNCLDAAPVLQRLFDEYREEDLQIVSLAFELEDNTEAGRRNLKIFQDRHGLTYTQLYCGDISRENVQERIGSQLENFGAYPTAIFVDRSGRVADIHKGFRGPGTGAGFQREIQAYYDLVNRIVRK